MASQIVPDPITSIDTAECSKHGMQKIRQAEHRRPEAGGSILHLNCGDDIPAPVAEFAAPKTESLKAKAKD